VVGRQQSHYVTWGLDSLRHGAGHL